MNEFRQAFYYSAAAEELLRRQGGEPGVLLVDGRAVLFTDSADNSPMRGDAASSAASCFADALLVYAGEREPEMLVDGAGALTPAGTAFCREQNIEAAPQALRAVALRPAR